MTNSRPENQTTSNFRINSMEMRFYFGSNILFNFLRALIYSVTPKRLDILFAHFYFRIIKISKNIQICQTQKYLLNKPWILIYLTIFRLDFLLIKIN